MTIHSSCTALCYAVQGGSGLLLTPRLKSYDVTIKMKATKQTITVTMFTILKNVALTLGSFDVILNR